MALRDYIICGDCGTKIIYDGYDNARDRLEEKWGDPKADVWTAHLLCPDCTKKLREQLVAATKLLRDLRDGDHIYGNDAEPLLIRIDTMLEV